MDPIVIPAGGDYVTQENFLRADIAQTLPLAENRRLGTAHCLVGACEVDRHRLRRSRGAVEDQPTVTEPAGTVQVGIRKLNKGVLSFLEMEHLKRLKVCSPIESSDAKGNCTLEVQRA